MWLKITVQRLWAHSVMLPPCYHWCVVASHDSTADQFMPLCLRASGPSSHAEPPWEAGCRLTCSTLPSSTSAAAAAAAFSLPGLLTHRFGVLVQCALLGGGLGSPGYRAQMGCWCCLLPSSPTRASRRGVEDRFVYGALVAPVSPAHRGQDRCPYDWFRKNTRENDREKIKCFIMVWALIS